MAEDEWWGGAHLWGHADPRIEPLSLKCHSALLMAAVTDTLINVDLIMDEAKVVAASAEADEPEQLCRRLHRSNTQKLKNKTTEKHTWWINALMDYFLTQKQAINTW